MRLDTPATDVGRTLDPLWHSLAASRRVHAAE